MAGIDEEGRLIIWTTFAGVVQRVLAKPSEVTSAPLPVLPVPGSCNQCGQCCAQGGACDLREAVGFTKEFKGTCHLQTRGPDGLHYCKAMAYARNPGSLWEDLGRRWHEPTRLFVLRRFMGSGCRWPHLRDNPDLPPP